MPLCLRLFSCRPAKHVWNIICFVSRVLAAGLISLCHWIYRPVFAVSHQLQQWRRQVSWLLASPYGLLRSSVFRMFQCQASTNPVQGVCGNILQPPSPQWQYDISANSSHLCLQHCNCFTSADKSRDADLTSNRRRHAVEMYSSAAQLAFTLLTSRFFFGFHVVNT